jgi:O-antigen/teichoic acid export membrane protein
MTNSSSSALGQAVPAVAPAAPAAPRLARVVGRLAFIQVLVANIGILTGPLLAHALGAEGRGLLAAIMAPLAIAPVLVSFGLGRYATRSSALGRPPGQVLGSIAPVLFALGLLGTISAPFVAEYLSNGNENVRIFLLIGLAMLPLTLLALLVEDVALGREQWSVVTRVRLIIPIVSVVGIVLLFVTGELRLPTAAATLMLAGLCSWIPLAGVVRGSTPFSFSLRELREGMSFGVRAWIGGLSSLANIRLDQLLMIKLVSPKDLGIYVVAFTFSTFLLGPILNAITSATSPRITRGDVDMFARSLRVTMGSVLVAAICLAALSPVVLRYGFGEDFVAGVPIVIVLLVGIVPGAGLQLMNSAISSAGRPGLTAHAELLALGVTIPGLILMIPAFGTIGAAAVSSVAYSFAFLVQLIHAKRVFGRPARELLLIERSDLGWAGALVRERVDAIKARSRSRRR